MQKKQAVENRVAKHQEEGGERKRRGDVEWWHEAELAMEDEARKLLRDMLNQQSDDMLSEANDNIWNLWKYW